MPPIIYTFHRPHNETAEPDTDQEVPLRTDLIHGHYLRHLPVLPNNISSNVEEFRMEAWLRMDSRIELDDIILRMHPDFRINEPALWQRGTRFREDFYLISWSPKKRSDRLENTIRRELINRGIDPARNSTRGLTPGLIDPDRGEDGGRIPVPAKYTRRPPSEITSVLNFLETHPPEQWGQIE